MRIRTIIIFLFLAGAAVAAYAAFAQNGADEATEVPTTTVRRGLLVELASATGTVEPDVFVEIKPRASGEVIAVLVEEGQQVATGDVLLKLDPTEREESLREAEASALQAQAKRQEAEATLAVSKSELAEARAYAAVRKKGQARGLLSSEERRVADSAVRVKRATVALREAQLAAAEASLKSAQLRVETATRLLEEMTVRAPIDATVLGITVERGSVVASGITNVGGGTAVLTLADLSKLLVVGQLDEAQVGRVREGQEVAVRVDAWPDRTFAGHVLRVSPLGEEESSVVTFDMDVAVSDTDAHLLRPGMSADIEVTVARHEGALLVPISALRSRGKRRFVTNAAGQPQPVQTGATDGTDIVILEGLAEGDAIRSTASAARKRDSDRPRRGPMGMPGGGGGPR